jgi:hypothetical protein
MPQNVLTFEDVIGRQRGGAPICELLSNVPFVTSWPKAIKACDRYRDELAATPGNPGEDLTSYTITFDELEDIRKQDPQNIVGVRIYVGYQPVANMADPTKTHNVARVFLVGCTETLVSFEDYNVPKDDNEATTSATVLLEGRPCPFECNVAKNRMNSK